MEVESWVMAHCEAFAEFVGVSPDRMPRKPDQLEGIRNALFLPWQLVHAPLVCGPI